MHTHSIRRALSALLLVFFGTPAMVRAQTVGDIPLWEVTSPRQPKCDVWIEGEAFQSQEGGAITADPECYGGAYWGVYTTKEAPVRVTYAFTVAKAGTWQISMAGQPVGTGYTSPIRLGLDGANPVALAKAPTSVASWSSAKAIRWMHLLVTNLSAGEHRITLEVSGKRPMDAQWAFRIDALALVYDPFAGMKLEARIATDRPANVYTTATPLTFRQTRAMKARELAWRVTDFTGGEVAAGKWLVSSPLTLGDLAPGYYRLWYRENDASAWESYVPFARVIDPTKRTLTPDSPFCVDTAQSWLARDGKHPLFPTNAFALTSDLVVLAGLTMVRDRMSWNQVNPETNRFIWTNDYSTNARLLAERGVKVTSVYHDAPAWAKGRNAHMPEDLFALYRFSKEMVKQWGSMITAWEFWNEQDISFCKDPAWEFAAAQKAAYLGYKAADPKAKVLIGAAAANLPIPRYFENIFENGVAAYFDAFNFHIYRELHMYDDLMADVTNFLGRYGAADKELWVTENGLSHEGGGKMKPLAAGRTEVEHDDDQERLHAEHLVKGMVMAITRGVTRDFWFVFPPYNERDNTKVWGLFRWDYTVKPAYAALANLTHQLGALSWLGRMDAGAGIEAHLWADKKGAQTLVWWSVSNDQRTWSIPSSAKGVEFVDILGKTRGASAENGKLAMTSGRFPQFARGLSGLKPAVLPYKRPAPSAGNRDLEVVLRFNPGEGVSTPNKMTARLDSNPAKASLDVFNFSSKAKEVRLRNVGKDSELVGLKDSVRVEPMSSLRLPLTLRTSSVGLFDLRLTGTCEGREISPAYVPFYLDMRSRTDVVARSLDILKVDRWRKNAAGPMAIERDEAEKAVKFKVDFPPLVDRWVYPEFPLEAGENLVGAVGISFDVRSERRSPKEITCLLMAVNENLLEKGKAQYFPYANQTTNWQNVLVQFSSEAPASWKPDEVKMLRIGCNPAVESWTFWVRDLKVYYKK